jgi:phytoene synthase
LTDAAVALAYKHCETITRCRARNFYYGIRLLPPRKRAAMCALYAMARRIDDIGDDLYGTGTPSGGSGTAAQAAAPVAGRLAALDEVRASLAMLDGNPATGPVGPVPPGDPVLTALADVAREFPLPVSALAELVEGCEWDITGRRYESFEELVAYCRRVAGTIGRLSLSIYGSSDKAAAEPLADALGVALQLTNILRDVIEDRDVMGRVYLPHQDLERFGVGGDLQGDEDDVMALICFETGRAAEWYERGLPLLGLLDKRSGACTAAMAGIYRRLLDKIRVRPEAVLRGRVSLSASEKMTVAALALARALA